MSGPREWYIMLPSQTYFWLAIYKIKKRIYERKEIYGVSFAFCFVLTEGAWGVDSPAEISVFWEFYNYLMGTFLSVHLYFLKILLLKCLTSKRLHIKEFNHNISSYNSFLWKPSLLERLCHPLS